MYEGGEDCLKCLKRGWNRKEGRGKKDFKKMGRWQPGARGGCLKKDGGRYPLRTMTDGKSGVEVEALPES